VSTNDPQRIVCDTPTDFIISSKETPLGYIEAEDVGVDLARAEETGQFKRCRARQRNIIGISLPLVFGLVIYGRLLFAADSMLSDPDTDWHIASGRWIIAHRTVPQHDVFSLSMPGAPWASPEWLAEILNAWLYDHLGWAGLVVAAAFCVAVALAMLLRALLGMLAPVTHCSQRHWLRY
jgi:hypothetical protein